MPNTDLWSLSAGEQAQFVNTGKVTPVELLESVISRVQQCNPKLHAYCTLDLDQARVRATAFTETLAAEPRNGGILAGVPVSIKDLIDTAGVRTTYGSVAYQNQTPAKNDVVVQRLLDADSVMIGKTNTSEFGYIAACHNNVFETTRNPWNLDRNPGGSSGGAAAAIASGMGSLAIGSDGGGSVRLPAALCGVVGFKGSFGLVPSFPGCRDPDSPGASSWESLEVIGVLARRVADVALAVAAIAGPDPRDRHSLPDLGLDWTQAVDNGITGARVAWTDDFGGLVTVDPQVRKVFRHSLRAFTEMGCTLVEAAPDLPELDATFAALIARDSDLRGLRALINQHGAENMLTEMVGLIRRDWTATEFTDAAMMQQRICNEVSGFMAD
ncbi:MAG: amidase, partial [Actinomycetia bacterium]|nr:amidase [Actinomycetes bacterium]